MRCVRLIMAMNLCSFAVGCGGDVRAGFCSRLRGHLDGGHSITGLAIAGGSRPARSQPATVAANGTPVTARRR
jgi:hypothetical protein